MNKVGFNFSVDEIKFSKDILKNIDSFSTSIIKPEPSEFNKRFESKWDSKKIEKDIKSTKSNYGKNYSQNISNNDSNYINEKNSDKKNEEIEETYIKQEKKINRAYSNYQNTNESKSLIPNVMKRHY